jgi:hypothetical protein
MTPARAAVGCLLGGIGLLAVIFLVRPLIYTLAPPRGDDAVALVAAGTLTGPTLHTVALVESHGLDGEVTAPDGHVEVTVVVAPAAGGAFTVVNASSPVEEDCPIEVLEGALVDCAGRRWGADGAPLGAGVPPLQRFAAHVESGVIVADMTRPLDAADG